MNIQNQLFRCNFTRSKLLWFPRRGRSSCWVPWWLFGQKWGSSGAGNFSEWNFDTSLDISVKWTGPAALISKINSTDFLVDGFNPSEKYESQWDGLSHILWENKNHVPNHQPVSIETIAAPKITCAFQPPWVLSRAPRCHVRCSHHKPDGCGRPMGFSWVRELGETFV